MYGREKSTLRVKCPGKVGEELSLAKEVILLIGQVERRKEWLQSRQFHRFCERTVRESPSNDFRFLYEVGSKVERGGDRALEDSVSLLLKHL